MGKQNTTKSTHKSEPQSSAVSKVPSFPVAMAEMSWRIAIPFMGLILGGNYLDSKFDTEPTLTVLGVLLAVAAVSAIVYRYVNDNFPGTFGGDA